MNDQKVSQDEVNELLEDVEYLGNEADALHYVIDEVPYDEAPPEGLSILSLLLLIDHAQKNYFRPIIEKAFKAAEPVNIDNYDHYRDSFKNEPDDDLDVFSLLRKISKHRAGLVNLLDQIPLIDWKRTLYEGEREHTLFGFVQRLVHEDRKLLKEIADLVMNHSQQIRAQKEIEQKSQQRAKGNTK